MYRTIEDSWTMLLKLLLVASIGCSAIVTGQNEIPTVPCYGPDCLVTEETTEMETSPATESTTTLPISTSRPVDIRRTLIVIVMKTNPGQDLFIRGGIDSTVVRPSCVGDTNAETSECAISINTTALGTGPHWDKYNAWREGDTKLDWIGAQPGQGIYGVDPAFGTPLAWTTNVVGQTGYQELNNWGPDNWMVDMEMNCDETIDGWFDLKGYLTLYNGNWEGNIVQATCTGTGADVSPPYSGTKNHVARCGYINRYNFNMGGCEINEF